MLHCHAGRCAESSGRSPQMGATITAGPGDRPPVTIHGGRSRRHPFHAGNAQRPGEIRRVARRIAGQRARPSVIEPASTRDHTERALAAFGATVHHRGPAHHSQRRPAAHAAATLTVPGDISSAAFMAVAAAAAPRVRRHDHACRPEPQPRGAPRRAETLRRRGRDDRRRRLERRAGGPPADPARRDDATS